MIFEFKTRNCASKSRNCINDKFCRNVAWGLAVNHGGGYSFRLCPRSPSAPLTEECFQRNPLAFVGNTTDIVGPHGEVRVPIYMPTFF